MRRHDETQMMMKINERVCIEDTRLTDLHMHTCYCDGRDTPEAMVQEAIAKGFSCIGFSGHSYVAFDPKAGIDPERRLQAYVEEIGRLKAVYAGKIRIFCGIELDYHTVPETGTGRVPFDYIIGSVHYIPLDYCTAPVLSEAEKQQKRLTEDFGKAGFAAVDDTPQILMDAVRDHYNGDYYSAAEAYYQLEADVVNRTGCDIIGHFDLFSKFNQKYQLFDEQHSRYVKAWKRAADQLLSTGKVFEINTGGMSRGWRNIPYPAPEIQEYIRQKGGRFILSSDSHCKETIGYHFDHN